MKQAVAVGIDIGSTLTRVVVCQESSHAGKSPIVLGVGMAETKGMRQGYVANRDEVLTTLKEAVSAAQKESGLKIRSAVLSIGGVGISCEVANGAAVVSRADSIISKFDIEKAILEAETQIELKNKTILHAFPLSFKVDGKELPTRPEGITGGKIEARCLFVTCLEQHLDDLISVVNEAGIKISSFIATPLATERLVLTDLQRNFGCALIDFGAETISVSIFENTTLTTVHVFAIGSRTVTKDIALGLRVPPEEAESLKLGVMSFQHIPKKKLDEIIEARLSDMFELIDKYFKKIGRSGLLPAGAILIGGGSNLAMIETVAKTALKIPVKLGSVDIVSIKGPIKDQRFITAYCAAASALQLRSAKTAPASFASGDGDDFLTTIKNFFKQLMP